MYSFNLKNTLFLLLLVLLFHSMEAQTVRNISSYSNKTWPADLNKEKLLYVNISPEEYAGSNTMINNNFVSKLKDYPFEYTVFEKFPSDSSQYKYQLHVSREIITYRISTTDRSQPYMSQNKTYDEQKIQFIAYIRNIKTGEIYCATPDPEWFYSTMKKFIKSVNKQFKL